MTRNLPDVQAIDPSDCGCTECLIGEYVQEGRWFAAANAYDIAAFLNGEVRNNTYNANTLDFVQAWQYSEDSAVEFCERFMRELNDMLESGRAYNIADPDVLARQVSR